MRLSGKYVHKMSVCVCVWTKKKIEYTRYHKLKEKKIDVILFG